VTLFLALLACSGPDGTASQAERYASALRTGDCAGLAAGPLRDDCVVADVERTGTDRCAEVQGERARGECWFRLAEARSDAALCARAAPFVDDCAMHVLTRGFDDWLPRGARPGAIEDVAAPRIAAAGLAADDPRPWSALYRTVLGRTRPFDRSACADAPDDLRREACFRTGLVHYADLLNHARDRGLYPCDGGPLPALLAHTPDPELDALRASRTDLCTPRTPPTAPTAAP
jgi:hypothetical protein